MTFNNSLIAAVFTRRALWDPRYHQHKNRSVCLRLWEEIAKEMDVDCEVVKQKWKGLKDYHRSQVKKMAEGQEKLSESKWPHFEAMNFLNETSRTYPPEISFKEESVQLQGQIMKEEDEEGEMEMGMESPNQYLETIISTPREAVIVDMDSSEGDEVKGRKRSTLGHCHNGWSEQPPKRKYLSWEDLHDEDLMFFRSLLPDFKALPRQRKMFVKLKIQELIYNETISQETSLDPRN